MRRDEIGMAEDGGEWAVEPVSFRAGREWLERKVDLPSGLSAAEMALAAPERVRRQAFFSAKVSSASVLGALREEVEKIERGETSYADARMRITEFLAREGYGIPAPGTEGDTDIEDLASTARLELVLRQNVAMAHAMGQREFSEHPAVQERYPNYRYDAVGDERTRDTHAALDGLVLPKDHPFWRTHFPPWEFNCRCIVYDSDEPVNGRGTGFEEEGETERERDDAVQIGTVSVGGRTVNLLPNESGFVFRSDPKGAMEEPGFEAILDSGLRQVFKAQWEKRFGAGDVAAPESAPEKAPEPVRPKTGKEARDELDRIEEGLKKRFVLDSRAIDRMTDDVQKGAEMLGDLWSERGKMRGDQEGRQRILDERIRPLEAKLMKLGNELRERIRVRDARLLTEARERIVYRETTATPKVEWRSKGITGESKSRIEEGIQAISRIVGAGPLDGQAVGVVAKRGRRAHYLGDAIYMTKGEGPGVVVHELGHWLEDRSAKVHQAAVAFLNSRTQGETAESLRKVTGIKGYKPHEVTKKDKFADAYMGKQYGGQRYTEIVSMGVELLYRDPVGFARKDPEMFDWIFNLMRSL